MILICYNIFGGIMELNTLSGIEFENLIKQLLSKVGFSVIQTKASHDGGIDLIANTDVPFFQGKYIIQCKRYSGVVGEPIIRDLYGVITNERANKGILITTGKFTYEAKKFAENKNIELIDGLLVSQLLNKYSLLSIQHNSFIDSLTFDKKLYLFLKQKIREKKGKLTSDVSDIVNFINDDEVIQLKRMLYKASLNKDNFHNGLIEELMEIEKLAPSIVNIKIGKGYSARNFVIKAKSQDFLESSLIYALNNDYLYCINELKDIKYVVKLLYYSGIYKDFNKTIIDKYCQNDILINDLRVEDIKNLIVIENVDNLVLSINQCYINLTKKQSII